MRVVFATYQSISVVARAQAEHGLPDFDLVLCDEAHRTTGATFAEEDQSNFVKVHDNRVVRGSKRLYMTATPRIYGENAKSKARQANAVLVSMDDRALYRAISLRRIDLEGMRFGEYLRVRTYFLKLGIVAPHEPSDRRDTMPLRTASLCKAICALHVPP